MKRKVTDVDSKVEALKDLLRDRRLSVPVIQYLNFIAQGIYVTPHFSNNHIFPNSEFYIISD